jgi:hypothetical protein
VTGKIVSLDGEKLIASIRTGTVKQRFHISVDQVARVKDAFLVHGCTVNLRKTAGRFHLIGLHP